MTSGQDLRRLAEGGEDPTRADFDGFSIDVDSYGWIQGDEYEYKCHKREDMLKKASEGRDGNR